MAKRVSVEKFSEFALLRYGRGNLTRSEVKAVGEAFDVCIPNLIWDYKDPEIRNRFNLPVEGLDVSEPKPEPAPVQDIQTFEPKTSGQMPVFNLEHGSLIPDKYTDYVPWGTFHDYVKIFESNMFLPVWDTGPTGCGKTVTVEQAAAEAGRELVRINFNIQTDEDDMIGGFRLIDGDTIWVNGPVLEAMEKGAILLLDDVDFGGDKLLCLQSILEGGSYFIKKISKSVKPTKGFTVVATSNTKGDGGTGEYVYTNVMNLAFLDRFPIQFNSGYPTPEIEKIILTKKQESLKGGEMTVEDQAYIERLVKLASTLRASYEEETIDVLFSTRRLVDVVRTNAIFNDIRTSLKMVCDRFDEETAQGFMELWDTMTPSEPVRGADPVEEHNREEQRKANASTSSSGGQFPWT